jgi:hypothetical protein
MLKGVTLERQRDGLRMEMWKGTREGEVYSRSGIGGSGMRGIGMRGERWRPLYGEADYANLKLRDGQ